MIATPSIQGERRQRLDWDSMATRKRSDRGREAYVRRVADRLGSAPGVWAVVLSGSRGAGRPDATSDYDLYVYSHREPDLALRRAIGGEQAEIGNHRWEPGDEWTDGATGARVDVMYRTPAWIEDQLDRVLVRHQASLGYSTCIWFNVLHSQILFDPRGWFADLQKRAGQPYPEPLRAKVIELNWPVLRDSRSSYLEQVERAVKRRDWVSVNHRVAAMLASFFDVWFALERRPHPGEKRLLSHLPPMWRTLVHAVVSARPAIVLPRIDRLLDALAERMTAACARTSSARIEHGALWVADLERSLAFYRHWFPIEAGGRYESTRRKFSSYFLRLPDGARLELMQAPGEAPRMAHFAVSVGSAAAVDRLVRRMESEGVRVVSGPRTTGDGCYEAVVLDPDGIEIEVTV